MHNFANRHHQHQQQPQHSFNFVKLDSFSGYNDPTLYLAWEAKVEKLFNVYKVPEDQKVRITSLVFLDYALQWWQQSIMDIGLNKRPIVVSWYDLKECMCARFVPPYYRKELLLKLQRFQQGPSSVDEYFKELETILTKIDMHESEESKIAKFVSGLRRKIQDVVEIYEYSSLEKMVHLAIKVESQLSKKNHFKNSHNDGYYQSSWKNKNKSSSKTFPSDFEKDSTYNPRHSKPSTSIPKSPTKTPNTKCFKCLGFGHIATNCPTKSTKLATK